MIRPIVACAVLWIAAAAVLYFGRKRIHVEGTAKGSVTRRLYLIGLCALALLAVMSNWERNPTLVLMVLSVPPAAVLAVAALVWFKSPRGKAVAEALQSGDLDTALQEARAMVEKGGRSHDVVHILGLVHCAREEWSEALAAFQEAELKVREGAKSGPADALDEAVRAFDEEEPLTGAAAIYRANRALALWKLGQPEKALPILEQACRDLPTDVGVALNLVRVYAELGRTEDAKEELRRAEQLAGPNAQIRKELESCRELLS